MHFFYCIIRVKSSKASTSSKIATTESFPFKLIPTRLGAYQFNRGLHLGEKSSSTCSKNLTYKTEIIVRHNKIEYSVIVF